jgi:aryl sulfotransferase
MRQRAALLAPNRQDILHDPTAFFRRDSSGAASAALDDARLARYHERAAGLAAPELATWLHR